MNIKNLPSSPENYKKALELAIEYEPKMRGVFINTCVLTSLLILVALLLLYKSTKIV